MEKLETSSLGNIKGVKKRELAIYSNIPKTLEYTKDFERIAKDLRRFSKGF